MADKGGEEDDDATAAAHDGYGGCVRMGGLWVG